MKKINYLQLLRSQRPAAVALVAASLNTPDHNYRVAELEDLDSEIAQQEDLEAALAGKFNPAEARP